MLTGPAWLALETKYVEPVRGFYEDALDLPVRREGDGEVTFEAGESDLILREPTGVPRGGLHVHYAFSIPAASYDDWYDRLDASFDLEEVSFGNATSLYCYDPEGNCVELGQDHDVEGSERRISGIFEVVLEVEDLDRAERFYRTLGFDVVDRGDERKRVRLTVGDLDVELWEPHLGLADARGGVHVDLGLAADDPEAVADRVAERALAVEEATNGLRIRDPDGHWLTLEQE